MAIFGVNKKAPVTENLVEDPTFKNVVPTAESLDMIITESSKDFRDIRGAMYISDVMMEEQVLEGTSTPEVLLESFGKDLFAKIKEKFLKLLSMVKDWFNKVKKALVVFFTSGKVFIDKFEKELNEKDVKGFKYHSFKYTFSAGESKVNEMSTKISDHIHQYINVLTDLDDAKDSTKQGKALASGEYNKEYNTSEEKETLVKALGGANLEEVFDNLHKAFRGGAEEKEEFSDFGNNSKGDMISTIKEKAKLITSVETEEKKIYAQYDRILKAIDTAAGRFKGEEYSKVSAYVSHSTEMMRYGVGLMTTIGRIEIDVIKEMAREFESTLKGFLRFKPAAAPVKEGTETIDENKEVSIFESAMKFV